MKQIDCSAKSCIHNHNGICKSDIIQVSAFVCENESAPYCDSFTQEQGYALRAPMGKRMRQNNLREYSKEIASPETKPCQCISCLLSDCVYNEENACHAPAIHIDSPAQPASTFCFCTTYAPKGS